MPGIGCGQRPQRRGGQRGAESGWLEEAASNDRLVLLMLVTLGTTDTEGAEVSLFDGKTLDGWEGNRAVWRIEDGAITGGSLEGNPNNEFLATTKRYRNFILRLEYRIVGTEGFVNGGVQIHSDRLKEPAFEMIGFQADIGPDRSGNLYDESRRKKALVQADKALVAKIAKRVLPNNLHITAYSLRTDPGEATNVFVQEPGKAKELWIVVGSLASTPSLPNRPWRLAAGHDCSRHPQRLAPWPLRTLANARAPPNAAKRDPDKPRELQLVLDPEFL